MKTSPTQYEELINLEGLDRVLKVDIQALAAKGDLEGVSIAQLARRECQNRMLQITLGAEAEE